jgi:hypothetical protein
LTIAARELGRLREHDQPTLVSPGASAGQHNRRTSSAFCQPVGALLVRGLVSPGARSLFAGDPQGERWRFAGVWSKHRTMTMHESLKFLDALHKHIERQTSKPGPGCWPTRELVARTFGLNRKVYPRDASPANSFNRQLQIALRRHWIASGGCQPGCHAQHLTLTPQGMEALRLMNAEGCGPQCSEHRNAKPHFERKVA